MKNINRFNPNASTEEFSYSIDWSLFEGEIEYDYLNEELKVVFSDHSGKKYRMQDFKIEPYEIEDILQKASSELIRQYNNNFNKERHHFLIRDRSKVIPYEIIMVVDKGREFPTEKTHIAVVGELYSKSKIDKLKRQFQNYQLEPGDPDIPFINYINKTGMDIKSNDYLFQVITTRRKEDFRVDSDKYIILEVHPDATIRVAE